MRRWSVAYVAALVLVLAGCGQDVGGSGGGSAAGGRSGDVDDALVGRTFLSSEVTVDGSPRSLVDGNRVELSFQRDHVGAYAGCNHLGGPARTVDGRLLVHGMGGTEMGCAPAALYDQDDWLVRLLGDDPEYALDGDRLTVTVGDTVVELLDEEVATPDRPLVGTEWVLGALRPRGASPGTVSSVPAEVRSTLQLVQDSRRYLVEPGCNSGGGRVDVSGRTVTFVAGPMTVVGCTGPRQRIENAVLDAMDSGPLRWDVDVDRLTLRNNGHRLTYRAAAGSPTPVY